MDNPTAESPSLGLYPAGSAGVPDPARPRRDIRGKLTLSRLPAMPPVLMQLLDLIQRDDLYLGDLAALIGRDVGLVSRTFSAATSAAFLGRNRPASLDQCLSLLGVNAVKTIVINESVMRVFNHFADIREVNLDDFWEHSLRCALIARELARRLDYPSPDEAYLGGLMHDVGRLAMLATDPEGYKRIFREHEDGESLCTVEHGVFALTHVEVGAWLVEKWGLDSFLGDSVLYHHEPLERLRSAPLLVRIVRLAECLANTRGQQPTALTPEALTLCDTAIGHEDELLDGVEAELQRLAEQFGIKLSTQKMTEAEAEPAAATKATAARDDQLAARVRDILLVNQALSGFPEANTHQLALQATVQAANLLFEVEASLCFEPTPGASERYRARLLGASPAAPLSVHSSRVAQLEFVAGSSAALLARSMQAGPQLVMGGGRGLEVLDEQLLRSLGGAGVLYLPLRSRSTCPTILVAPIASADQAAALGQKLPCLAYFGRMSAERLAQTSRLEAFPLASATNPAADDGRLNRLVHELNNPLAIIRNYVAILETENASKGSAQPELAIVREEIDRAAKLLKSARQQASPEADIPPSAPGQVDLNRTIGDLVSLIRKSMPQAGPVEIRLALADKVPTIVSDRDRLKQLLVNLIKNAMEAMPKGGSICVATAPWGLGEAGPSHVEIRVEDNGPGIPREVLARLYQQVASSKAGEHQGLGLAIVGQLVRELNGLINCRSGDDGTRFQVLLPMTRQTG
ncbi:MAG TPA: HDOD domain-containing protein [Azospira sp.]|nr:HDOD domain-containing protein [Azospira sp.]